MADRTVAFEFEGETKYLILPSGSLTDEELAIHAEKAIFQQVVQKYLAQGKSKPESEMLNEAQAVTWHIVDAATLPPDRYFRRALVVDKGCFAIDMDKATEIHMDQIRQARDAQLAILDIETIKAGGKQDMEQLQIVEAQKQVLRDIPQTFDLSKAKTPEELRALWPAELS